MHLKFAQMPENAWSATQIKPFTLCLFQTHYDVYVTFAKNKSIEKSIYCLKRSVIVAFNVHVNTLRTRTVKVVAPNWGEKGAKDLKTKSGQDVMLAVMVKSLCVCSPKVWLLCERKHDEQHNKNLFTVLFRIEVAMHARKKNACSLTLRIESPRWNWALFFTVLPGD